MLSLGCIVISDLVVNEFFMHSLSGMYDSTLLGRTIFYTEGVLHEIITYVYVTFISIYVCSYVQSAKVATVAIYTVALANEFYPHG